MEKSRIDLPIGITLDRFIKSNENQYPNAAGELSQLLRDIALASKVVNREINKAGLIDIMGNMGQQNLGGDEQQKLDLLANIRFTRALSKGGEACGIISEETESFIDLKNKGKYIVSPKYKRSKKSKKINKSLYSNGKNKPKIKSGYGSAEIARKTLKYIKGHSRSYKMQIVNTMYNRAKHHKYQTSGMKKAMKIYKSWLSKNK